MEPPALQRYGAGAQVGDLNIFVGRASGNQAVEKDAFDYYATCWWRRGRYRC